jgi:hypothetical protein
MDLDGLEPEGPAEQTVLKRYAVGETTDFRRRQDEKRPTAARPDNQIRGVFLRALLFKGMRGELLPGEGLTVRGAWVTGDINFECGRFPRRFGLLDCTINGRLIASDAEFFVLGLEGSSVAGITAFRLKCEKLLSLRRGFLSGGPVNIPDAKLGQLACDGGHFCRDADSDAPGSEFAVQAARAVVEGGAFFQGTRFDGAVSLVAAQIRGDLECGGTHFDSCGGVVALNAARIDVQGTVFLKNARSDGRLVFIGAHIGGDLDCGGAWLDGKGQTALSGERLKVDGSLFMSGGFRATGQVRLLNSSIAGNLNATRATLSGSVEPTELGGGVSATGESENIALGLGGAKIGGSVFLRENFRATGEVRLRLAEIASDLELVQATLSGAGKGAAFDGAGAVVKGAIVLRKSTITSRMILRRMRIGVLSDDLKSWGPRIVLDGFHYDRIDGDTSATLRRQWLAKQPARHLRLEFRPQPWEQLMRVLREAGHPEQAKEIAIAKQDAVRSAGLAVWKRARRRWGWRAALVAPLSRLLRWFLHWTLGKAVGYGYKPHRLIWAAVAVWLGCALFFGHGHAEGGIAPTHFALLKDPQFQECERFRSLGTVPCSHGPHAFRSFNPLLYSLEVILPVVNLQQKQEWAPVVARSGKLRAQNGNARVTATGSPLVGSKPWRLGIALRWMMWVETLFGWVATVVLLAVMSGLVKKD